jgi:hypothetical protein
MHSALMAGHPGLALPGDPRFSLTLGAEWRASVGRAVLGGPREAVTATAAVGMAPDSREGSGWYHGMPSIPESQIAAMQPRRQWAVPATDSEQQQGDGHSTRAHGAAKAGDVQGAPAPACNWAASTAAVKGSGRMDAAAADIPAQSVAAAAVLKSTLPPQGPEPASTAAKASKPSASPAAKDRGSSSGQPAAHGGSRAPQQRRGQKVDVDSMPPSTQQQEAPGEKPPSVNSNLRTDALVRWLQQSEPAAAPDEDDAPAAKKAGGGPGVRSSPSTKAAEKKSTHAAPAHYGTIQHLEEQGMGVDADTQVGRQRHRHYVAVYRGLVGSGGYRPAFSNTQTEMHHSLLLPHLDVVPVHLSLSCRCSHGWAYLSAKVGRAQALRENLGGDDACTLLVIMYAHCDCQL